MALATAGEMDKKTTVAAISLVVSTMAFTLVFSQVIGFHRDVVFLMVTFWVVAALAAVLAMRVRRSPLVVIPLVLASVVALVVAAPSVPAWMAWSVNGFAP